MNLITHLKAFLLAAILLVGVSYASAAWTNPPASPPDGNVDAPINVSGVYQDKLGILGLGGLIVGVPELPDRNEGESDEAYKARVGVVGDFVKSRFNLSDGNEGAGKVLVSNEVGYATWQTVDDIGSNGGGNTGGGSQNACITTSGVGQSISGTQLGTQAGIAVDLVAGGENICADGDACTLRAFKSNASGTSVQLLSFDTQNFVQLPSSGAWVTAFSGTNGDSLETNLYTGGGMVLSDDVSGFETSPDQIVFYSTSPADTLTVVVCD